MLRSFILAMLVAGAALTTTPGVTATSPGAGATAVRAKCGPGDRTESGLQGQVTLAERYGPGNFRAYNCNLELVGQFNGDGVGTGFAATDKCAYGAQWKVPVPLLPALKHPGVMVVDASDPAKPKLTGYLSTPGMVHAQESLLLHAGRRLLIGQNLNKNGEDGRTTDIYDVSDCAHPKMLFSGVIPGFVLHTADFSPDGTILWAATGPVLRSEFADDGDTLTALDIKDPASPKILAKWRTDDPRSLVRFHNIAVSDDGRTAYFTIGEHTYSKVDGRVVPSPNQGIGILDVSEVQDRKPGASIRLIGGPYYWNDIVHNQFLAPFTVKGHKYLWENRLDGVITTDAEVHVGDPYKRLTEKPEDQCRKGQPAWGYVSIFDVQDPARAKRVSALRLEVHDPKNCVTVAYDPVVGHGYSPINCNVDNYQDAKMIACGFNEAGLRVFDIRDVTHPKEIGYYKPEATGAAPRAGSPYQTFRDLPGITAKSWKFHTADGVSDVAFAQDGKQLWFTSFDGGFHIVQFSDQFMQAQKELFAGGGSCYGGLRPRHGCP